MNELRSKYKTFEDGLEDFLDGKVSQERDCGNYAAPTKKDLERWTNQFKALWESENFELPKSSWW